MGINSINNNPNVGGVNPSIDTDKTRDTQKTSLFGGITSAKSSSDAKKGIMNSTSNIKQHTLDATDKATSADDVKTTPNLFSGIKLSSGETFTRIKNKMGNGGNITNKSLENRQIPQDSS